MPDAETAPGSFSSSGRPRIGQGVWRFGLVACVLIACSLTAIAYAEGLPWWVQQIAYLDKMLHFGIGGALAFFLDGVLRRRAVRVGHVAVPLAAVLLLAPMAIEEFLQRYSINRTSSISDFAADTAGVLLFIWLSRWIGR